MIARFAVSNRVGATIVIRGKYYIVKRPLWWKVALQLKPEFKKALDPWTYWYYEINLTEKPERTEVKKETPETPKGHPV